MTTVTLAVHFTPNDKIVYKNVDYPVLPCVGAVISLDGKRLVKVEHVIVHKDLVYVEPEMQLIALRSELIAEHGFQAMDAWRPPDYKALAKAKHGVFVTVEAPYVTEGWAKDFGNARLFGNVNLTDMPVPGVTIMVGRLSFKVVDVIIDAQRVLVKTEPFNIPANWHYLMEQGFDTTMPDMPKVAKAAELPPKADQIFWAQRDKATEPSPDPLMPSSDKYQPGDIVVLVGDSGLFDFWISTNIHPLSIKSTNIGKMEVTLQGGTKIHGSSKRPYGFRGVVITGYGWKKIKDIEDLDFLRSIP